MPRRRLRPSVLYHFDQQTLRRIQRTPDYGFHVGVWWQDDERVVAFLQSIAEIKATGYLIDSDLSHDSAWETARRELSCAEATEFFDVPRGRILWDTAHQAGIIYHGNSTPAEVFDDLARLYRLPRWQARLDEHYLTGEALEEFYRLD
ncbi:hypothetical protein [Planctellipticum variicoloris]|uniref:hypothetical protein n=1 Tax=Planctellipticum variicoloris TaxID=3064265 RepID=UPI003013B614|nr:hypothetical protein SH412_003714 [Planctomycetaceae bacterium SH412]